MISDLMEEIQNLKQENKEMFKKHQDYFVENEKLKQDLAEEIEGHFELYKDYNFALKEIEKLKNELDEYKKFGLDKDLENLKKLK